MAPSLRQEHLTMSMTIFLSDCLCFFVMFWKISQFSSWSSLKPTARWWFSSTDSSLYMSASSESEKKKKRRKDERDNEPSCSDYDDGCWHFREAKSCPLTCVDEELVRNTRMIHIMDGCCKNSSQDLQISKDSLGTKIKQDDEETISVEGLKRSPTLSICSWNPKEYKISLLTSSAGVDRRICVDWATSAAWRLLW